MIQGEAGCMKQLKLWMFLICFALGFDSSEGKKCCVSRAYAVCWVTPNFWENALTAEKNKLLLKAPQHGKKFYAYLKMTETENRMVVRSKFGDKPPML